MFNDTNADPEIQKSALVFIVDVIQTPKPPRTLKKISLP